MSLSEVRAFDMSAIPLAVIRGQVRPADFAKVIPEGCGRVWDYVKAQQLHGGRHVALYWEWGSTVRLEVGVEINDAFEGNGDIVRSATPAGPTVTVVHFGPYQQLVTAHQAIRNWCATNNRTIAGPSWEIYGHWQNEWFADSSQIRTDIFYQLHS